MLAKVADMRNTRSRDRISIECGTILSPPLLLTHTPNDLPRWRSDGRWNKYLHAGISV